MKAFLFFAAVATLTTSSTFATSATKPDLGIYWHAANDFHIRRAQCKTTEVPSVERLTRYLKKLNLHRPLPIQKIGNFKLYQQSRYMVETFEDLFDSVSTENFVQEFNIPSTCHDVLCAARTIWGEELGLKILYLRTRFGLNASEFAFSDADRFKIDEINDAILAILDLPSQYVHFMQNKRFTRYDRGYYRVIDGPNIIANSSMLFYDNWEQSTSRARQQTVFHEMAHNIGEIDDIDKTEAWEKVSGWRQVGGSFCKVSEYGDTSPIEDFAETVVMYRYRPDALKLICKEKYNFIKYNVFNGVEFDTNAHCSKTSRGL